MNYQTRDLIQFEAVEEVIKIRIDEKARQYVEKYVITESLRSNLMHMLEILSGPAHKSFNVVGNYGTGKSHFLAFVAALLEHTDFRSLVNDETVRAAACGLERRYLVVKFELGAAAEIPLRHIFFDQVQRQLLEKYDIEVQRVDMATAYDNKQNMLDILAEIKGVDPEVGLVVIVDEISDFLKQKPKEAMAYDLALLRELGEVSQDSDFLYIGAMQEHVFTNPRYVDQAESIARINQRFVTVTITKDDVAQVLTNRVVRKTADQRQLLVQVLNDHRQYFTNVAQQFDRYVDLFPIHPYVIDMFERLPYFENRGIIVFTVNNVREILDQPAPSFITYDRIFDLINATHEIRNQPDVAQVVQVVQTLQAKVDLLDARYRNDALKLIKALAVLKLLGGSQVNGATSQELANTLLITPPGRLLVESSMARDNIERIMKNIRDVTVGQYIAYGDGRYYLDLTKIDDYDAMIEKKAQAVVNGNDNELEQAFRNIITAELGITERAPLLAGLGIFDDSAPWPSRRSFRPGVLVVGKRSDGAGVTRGDYRFILQGPVEGKASQRQDETILAVEFTSELVALLTRNRAAELLAMDNVHKKVMLRLAKEAADQFRDKYLAQLLSQGAVLQGGHRKSLSTLQIRQPLNTIPDVVDFIKGEALDAQFGEKYPNYPTFRTRLTAANIESEMALALQSLDRLATQQLDMNSRGYLESFGAIQEGHFSASASPACALILQRIEEDEKLSRMTALDDLLRELARTPWGLSREMVYLLLGGLAFNGYVIFVRHGGARLHSGEISPLLKQGLVFFETIRYVERDRDIDAEGVAALFDMLGLQSGLVRDRDSRSEAVRVLRVRGQELQLQVNNLRSGMNTLAAEAVSYPGVPWLAVQERLSRLAWLDKPLNGYASVSRVSDLGALDTSQEFRQTLRDRLADLGVLVEFLNDWQEQGLGRGLKRMLEALQALPRFTALVDSSGQSVLADLQRIADDSRQIYTSEAQLLRSDLRRPLKGKLEQFNQKYDQLYFSLHRKMVGDEAPWAQVQTLRSSPRFQALNRLKGLPFLSPAEFNQIALGLQTLENHRCQQFSAQVLESFVICPYCRFPESGAAVFDLPQRLEQAGKQIEDLWQRWQGQIFTELPGLQDRLPLLSAEHRRLIEDLGRRGELPLPLSDELIEVLFELSSDLQSVELNLSDLADHLLAGGSALTMDEFRASLDRYIHDLLSGLDQDLVRIKITHFDKGEEH
jgi:KaiC/GvpD/RAD55 family RecA-like ATPase